MSIIVKFFRNANGNEPVRDWLRELDRADRKKIGDDLQTIQLGWRKGLIKEPLVKSLSDGLFEVRTNLPSHRISRVFFCLFDDFIVLLHGFIKKTQQTPSQEMTIARKRQKLVKQNIE